MAGYCFFAPEAQELVNGSGLMEKIATHAETTRKQTYVLHRPLSKEDATYDYDNAIVIFSSGMKPCFVNMGNDQDAFEDYIDDFIEDISYLSEKFKYREKIGRKKHWLSIFSNNPNKDIDFSELTVEKTSDTRLVDLITSLVVGSINDISKIDLEAKDLLSSVKSKIILFDTDQTSFVFRTGSNKKFVIQGLAGSGKTELLLHKIKEIYSRDDQARIAFTCFNKVLAASMRSRIPDFFDFMRVDRQIEWTDKLFCFHSWGSAKDPLSGMYRYICYQYEIAFGNLQSGTFESLCKRAIDDIRKIPGEKTYIFDYVFIDESQDFPDSFIDLCELVTEKKVFVAGDVFQNIFQPIDDRVNRADMVLKKCYRTDPKNLMFSHALGMGLFETPVLRWLKPGEWDSCGYRYSKHGNRAHVSRDPLRRFEDIPNDFKSTTIQTLNAGKAISESLLEVVNGIKLRHPSVRQGDIAVIFLDRSNYIYNVIPELKLAVKNKFNWDANVSFETKMSDPDKFFISNINNAKGLEFPFVICFAQNLNQRPAFRNALYTMMARSFLESHLILGANSDNNVVEQVRTGLDFMSEKNYMDLRIPSAGEIEAQKDLFVLDEAESLEDSIRQFGVEKGASPRLIGKLISRVTNMIGDSDYSKEYLDGILNLEYERHRDL
ncbi:ATP-binding domain-containing protein [Microbulbifer variabilis]|uniref:ATP-binding domain-containing protein n=1 Tax=Microbulbifer variabilis TaxID=266805 RepID=A0ABY4V7F2_9GAMM|nr:ATP-binding domain-containing protein [Microbulbifer variabilis]USD20201.1 ATP-binding domain-containing protein [Microbulbifer variabilis]